MDVLPDGIRGPLKQQQLHTGAVTSQSSHIQSCMTPGILYVYINQCFGQHLKSLTVTIIRLIETILSGLGKINILIYYQFMGNLNRIGFSKQDVVFESK